MQGKVPVAHRDLVQQEAAPVEHAAKVVAVRGDAADAEIADAWRAAMWGKLAGHGIDEPGFLQPDRPMSAIGG